MKEDIHNLLKKDIENKIGKRVLYSKDCARLSAQIYKTTRRQISSSTIKRFFGIIKSRFNPSKYTLDTLVVFLGFKDWNDYLNCYDEKKYYRPNGNSWDFLKNRIQLVTKHSLDSLKQKTNYTFEKTLLREFVQDKFKRFEQSDKIATMFVAPEGYGKSTLLIQLVEKYFMNDKAAFNHDIVALIDGGIFFNLYARNSNIELLNQLLEFKISSSLGHFFLNNPEQRKGRVWMIIDNIDEIFFDQESYHQLAENIMRIIMANDQDWFRLILTCRPENLDIFSYLVQKNPLMQASWFEVNFNEENMAEQINVPLFNTNEIKTLLEKYEFEHDFNFLKTYHQEILKIICYPYLFSLFAEGFKQNEEASEILLLSGYIKQRLYSPPFMQEKIQLIDAFMELTQLGRKSISVHKENLLSKANFLSAYRHLISFGIIYEYNDPKTLSVNNTFVTFHQNAIFQYVLFEKWRNNSPLNSDLFFKIRDFYRNNLQLQCSLLNYFIRFLIFEKDFDTIKKVHTKLESMIDIKSRTEVPPCLHSISTVIRQAMHTDSQFRKNLTPWLTRSTLRRILYSGNE